MLIRINGIGSNTLAKLACGISDNLHVNNRKSSWLGAGTFATTDPDANDTFTYSIVSGTFDNAKFTINGNSNLKTAMALDFEQKQQ